MAEPGSTPGKKKLEAGVEGAREVDGADKGSCRIVVVLLTGERAAMAGTAVAGRCGRRGGCVIRGERGGRVGCVM